MTLKPSSCHLQSAGILKGLPSIFITPTYTLVISACKRRTCARGLKRANATNKPEALFPLAFLLLLVLNNITESFLLNQTNIYWVIYVTVAFCLNQKESTFDEECEEEYIGTQRERHVYIN